jgi:hypothetical protein
MSPTSLAGCGAFVLHITFVHTALRQNYTVVKLRCQVNFRKSLTLNRSKCTHTVHLGKTCSNTAAIRTQQF